VSAPPRGPFARILVVRLGAIGDVVNTLPAVTALRRGMPDATIHWAVERKSEPLLRGHPAIDRAVVFPREDGPAAWIAFVRRLRDGRYDLAIDFQRTAKSALLAASSGARVRLGFDRARSKEFSWWLATHRLPARPRTGTLLEQYLEFPAWLGVADEKVVFGLRASAEDRAWAASLEPRDVPWAVLHVGASKPANRWSPGRFASLAGRIRTELGLAVVLVGGAEDRSRAERIESEAAPAPYSLVGETSLPRLIAVLERAAVVVSCDSGPLHLAVALGRPVVGLYGAANPRRTGPWGPRASVVRGRVWCSPCRRRSCFHMDCMRALDTDSVMAAVRERLVGATLPAGSPAVDGTPA